MTAAVLGHAPVAPSELWSSWRPDPVVTGLLVLAAVVYRQGLVNLRARARPGPRPTQVAAFAAGLAAAAVALVSPLDGAAASLFTAHMVQHLLLMMVVAPLLAAGRPLVVLGAALPVAGRRRLRRVAARRPAAALFHPVAVWALGTVVLWGWHLPALYDAAVRNDAVHAVEHLSLVGVAAVLWAAVLDRGPRPLAAPAAVGLLFATMLQSSGLGAVLTLAGSPLYDVHRATTSAWGLTPLEDQQLAGALMWVPPGVVYLGVMAGLLVRWLGSLDTPPAPPSATAPPGRVRAAVPTGDPR
jgi:putative membrane protein